MSEPRRLTEPEAWREVARRYAERLWFTPLLFVDLDVLRGTDLIDDSVFNRARERVRMHVRRHPRHRADYIALNEEDAVLAALFLALDAEAGQ